MNIHKFKSASKWAFIGLFSLIALILAVGGYWFYRHEIQTIRSHAYNDLKAVAELKANQITLWRNERIADARLNAAATFLRSAVVQWLKSPDNAGLKSGIKARLQLLKDSSGYENVILASTDGRVLFTLNPGLTDLESETKRLVSQTSSARQVVFGDFFRCSVCKQVHLDVAAPILDRTEVPAAVLILRTHPEDYLYPLIQTWPIMSKSAETLLIRQEGDDVLFLNILRHRTDPALTLRIPLSRTGVPAVQGVLGQTGMFEGGDYRGVKVLSEIRGIPNSSWVMVAKVDRDEIFAEAAARARLIGFLTLALILMSGAGTAFIYKHKGKRTFEALFLAERQRAETLEEARVTLYSIGDAVISTGPAGRVRQMNPVAEQLTGWKEAEVLDKPLSQVFQIVNEKTRAEVENPVERVLREGVVVGLANHTLLIAKDGTERPIADSGAPIRSESGTIRGVVLVFRDQTEERAAQKALRESQEQLRIISENIRDTVWLMDLNFRITWISASVVRTLGYTLEELAGMPLERHLTPESLVVMSNLAAANLTADKLADPKAEITVNGEFELIRKDGSTFWADAVVTLLRDKEGRPTGFLGVGRDITERKRAEETMQTLTSRQEALLSAIPDIIMEVDQNKIYTWANQPGYAFFGEDVIGKEAAFYFEGEQTTYQMVQPLFFGVEDVIYVESWQRRQDGEKRLLAWWCRVLKDQQGNVIGALSTARDVTESKRAEEEIQRLNESLEQRIIERTAQLEAANKELEAFSYSVSHDLRAPLRGIDGLSLALLEDNFDQLDHQGQDFLKRIRAASQHMAELIDDLLKLSRVTRSELRRSNVDLSALSQAISEELKRGHPERRVEFVIQPGMIARGDVNLLKIVIEQLLRNAWKFTGKHFQARIEVGAIQIEGETAFFVRDDGAGFDMTYADHLFGAFQRLHSANEFEGTGIGLATVKRIIHRHGGRVWGEGVVEKGATFYFTLSV
ncbi:MAG: PAS domain S-box protein [Deltaproteobacteria bacterium]|nr:PAS domain S-box protein [Deltaproteobacteria bacterium]